MSSKTNAPPPPGTANLRSEKKFADILNFLEEVENDSGSRPSATHDLASSRKKKSRDTSKRLDRSLRDQLVVSTKREGSPRNKSHLYRDSEILRSSASNSLRSSQGAIVATNSNSAFEGIKEKLLALKTEVAHKSRIVEILKKKNRDAEGEKKDLAERTKRRIAELKRDAERDARKNLEFADQLVADKKDLSEKCERLARELEAAESSHRKKMEIAKTHWTRELDRQRKTVQAAERARREKWMEQKTRSIKQLTIKGLEPEIQRLIDKHRTELSRKEEEHREELTRLRAQLKKEHGDDLAHRERLWRQDGDRSLQKETENHLKELEKLQRKNEEKIELLLDRHAKSLRSERERHEEERRKLMASHAEELQKSRGAGDDRMEDLKRRLAAERQDLVLAHKREIEAFHRDERADREQWEKEMTQRMKEELAKRLKIKEAELKNERDRKLQIVVDRLNEESAMAHDEDIRRVEEKVKIELEQQREKTKQAQKAEAEWMHKYMKQFDGQAEMEKSLATQKKQLADAHAEIETVQRRVRQLTGALRQSQIVCEEHVEAKKKHAEEIRILQDRVVSEKSECKALLQRAHEKELQELLSKHKRELEEATAEHDQKLDHLNDRVRDTIFRKDETIAALREQLDSANVRMREFERLLGSGI